MRLIFDATAWRDLDDIGTWIARDNAPAAQRVLEHILQTTERLQEFPNLARPGRSAGTYECRVTGTPYIVVFQIEDRPKAVVVTAVVHGARMR